MLTDRQRLERLKDWSEVACTCGGGGPGDCCEACQAYHAADLGNLYERPQEFTDRRLSELADENSALWRALQITRACRDRWHKIAQNERRKVMFLLSRPTPDELLEEIEETHERYEKAVARMERVLDGDGSRREGDFIEEPAPGVQVPDDPDVCVEKESHSADVDD